MIEYYMETVAAILIALVHIGVFAAIADAVM